ncbi:hypothetical protein ACTXT7_016824 [Hymenolepis weldensis]
MLLFDLYTYHELLMMQNKIGDWQTEVNLPIKVVTRQETALEKFDDGSYMVNEMTLGQCRRFQYLAQIFP